MAEEHYVAEDSILPKLSLSDPCEIKIDITDEGVTLTIGPRDWFWERGHPDLSGAGTIVG